MHITTILNEKGGVGKTTLAITLSAAMAARGFRVLLVDADPQEGNLTAALGLPYAPQFYDFMVRGAAFAESMTTIAPEVYEPYPSEENPGVLWLMRGNRETRNINNLADEDETHDWFAVLRRLLPLRDVVDYIIFDTSPQPSNLHSYIIAASDSVIVPTKLETLSIKGAVAAMRVTRQYSQIREASGLPGVSVIGILPNQTRLSTNEHADNHAQLTEKFGALLWRGVKLNTLWAETTTAQQSIFAYAPTSEAAADGWRIAGQYMEATHVSA